MLIERYAKMAVNIKGTFIVAPYILTAVLVARTGGQSVAPDAPPATRPAASSSQPAGVQVVSTPVGSAPGQPDRIRVDEPEHDFGEIWDTAKVTHTFELVNTGDKPLDIFRVRTTCGCTTTDDWDQVVQPGATWKLPVTLVAANRRGKIRKTIMVDTSDPAQPQVAFNVEADIKPRFKYAPTQNVSFGRLEENSAVSRTLTITNQADQPVKLSNPTVINTDLLKVGLREIEPGHKYELHVETLPPLTTSIRGRIKIETDLEALPELVVYAYGYVRPRIALMPSTILVPQPLQSEFKRRLLVRAAEGTTVHVKEVEVTSPKIETKVETGKQGQLYYIWVTVPAGTTIPDTGDTLTITTDDEKVPTLTAPIRALKTRSGSVNRPRRATTRPAAPRVP
jgi:hypothetical protein